MNIIKIGEPLTTRTGTKISKYIENGRLYKLIDFEHSTNRVAKEKGLKKTVVKYGEGNKPVEFTDTFERTTKLPVTKPAEKDIPKVAEPQTPQKTAETANGAEKEIFGDDKLLRESFSDRNRGTLLYSSYDSFVGGIKKGLERYKDVIPEGLYKDINERYGTEERSIMNIIQAHGVDLDKVPTVTSEGKKRLFKHFIKATVNSENKLAEVGKAAEEEQNAIIYANAWTRSLLRQDFIFETAKNKNNPWSLIPSVWEKHSHPEETEYPTSKLIDSYLVQIYKNGRRSLNGENPIAKVEKETDIMETKTGLLKRLYRLSDQLYMEETVLRNPAYKELKKSADLEGMTKTIENIEDEYQNAFFEHFWTDERKARFSDALDEENLKFGRKVEISKDICKATMDKVMAETK